MIRHFLPHKKLPAESGGGLDIPKENQQKVEVDWIYPPKNQQKMEVDWTYPKKTSRKRRLTGHTQRKPAENVTHQALDWNPQGKRRVVTQEYLETLNPGRQQGQHGQQSSR